MFELDSDPGVHTFLGTTPLVHIDQSRSVIEMIRQQYKDNGIGRWAAIEKSTGNFIGWAGLKFEKRVTNGRSGFYDLGYRLIQRYWGKGFASEAALASVKYGFGVMNLQKICATADMNNIASGKILVKSGLALIETFMEDGHQIGWYELPRGK